MRIKSVAFAIVGFIFLSLIYPVESAKAVILEEFECFPAVLLLRGSDESNQGVNEFRKTTKNELGEEVPYGPALFRTNGNEGEILRRLLQEFTNYTQVEDTASKVRFIGVDYEALAVPGFPLTNGAQDGKESLDFWDHLLKYDESYRGGAKSVLSIINEDEKRGCNTKYMLVGYSQGVISARIAMNLLNNDTEKIFGSYVIGDPFQKANGANDPRQKSPANTSYDTYGAGNVGATVLTALAATDAKFLPLIPLIEYYRYDKIAADPIIYQNVEPDGAYSRSLCHEYDPVCGPKLGADMGQHLNYFSVDSDIEHEIAAFDSQVQLLANSSPSDTSHRTRELKGTVAVDGKVTYNVANSVPGSIYNLNKDDKCYWDIDSDGFEEPISTELNPDSGPTDCRNVDFIHTQSPAKMTVRIVDSFGITHYRSTEVEEVSRKLIEDAYKLDPNKWYQLRSIEDSSKCLAFAGQDNYEEITAGVEASMETCDNTEASGFNERASLSKQSFKAVDHHAANYPGEADEFGTRLAWGYDEDFNVDSANSQAFEGPLQLQANDDYSSHHFEPWLAKVENGIPYYFIRHRDGNCVTVDDFDKVNINWGCDGYPERQLFAATPLEGEFGNLSLEKDTTAPTQVENLEVSDIVYGSAKLSWKASVDDRLGDVKYEIYREPDVGSSSLVSTTSDTEISQQISVTPGMAYKFSVVAVDTSGNRSEKTEVSFFSYNPLSKPTAPTLESMNGLGNEVVINFPYSDSEPVEKIAIYKDYQFLEFSTGHLYTDSDLTPGQYYDYTYKTVTSQGIYSELSDGLSVYSKNNIAPSAPSNLELEWPATDIVWLKWDPSVDDTDSALKYHIYRDGIKLEVSPFASDDEWKGYDDNPTIGATHIYTIQAEDSYGNLSDFSNELSVAIPVPDTTPPTPPSNLSASYIGDNVLSLSWNPGTDDVDSYLYYHLYRDGQRLTEDAWAGENGGEDFTVVPGETYVYTLKAVDYSGNMSEFSEPLTVTIPVPDTEAPTKPILTLTSVNDNEIVFHINSSDNDGINYYEVYRDGELYSNVYGLDDTFTDYSIEMNQLYEYAVKAVDPSGNESNISDSLLVDTHDTTPPTPPTDLSGYYDSNSIVEFSWSPAEDNSGWVTTYHLYRDGVKLTENFYTYDLGGYDYLPEPGMTYVYTVIAEDSSGNLSEPSEPIIVVIPEDQGGGGEDITPPTKPEVSLIDAWDEVIGFSFHAEDDQGVSSFDIYRDGVFIANTYDWFYYDQGLTPETSYEYTVVARDYSDNTSETSEPLVAITTEAGGGSGPGDPGSEEPEVPTPSVPGVESFNLDYLAHNVAQISWTINNTTGLSYRYDIYRNGILVAENRSWNPYGGGINSSPEAYIDEGLEPDTTYTYEVVVKSWSGSSSPISSPFVVHTPSAPDGDADEIAPSGVKLVNIYESEHGISLGWTPAVDNTEVAAYEIYRDGILIHVLDTSAEDYYGSFYDDVEGASSSVGTTHSYQIVVVDSSGNRNDTSPSFDYTVGT